MLRGPARPVGLGRCSVGGDPAHIRRKLDIIAEHGLPPLELLRSSKLAERECRQVAWHLPSHFCSCTLCKAGSALPRLTTSAVFSASTSQALFSIPLQLKVTTSLCKSSPRKRRPNHLLRHPPSLLRPRHQPTLAVCPVSSWCLRCTMPTVTRKKLCDSRTHFGKLPQGGHLKANSVTRQYQLVYVTSRSHPKE